MNKDWAEVRPVGWACRQTRSVGWVMGGVAKVIEERPGVALLSPRRHQGISPDQRACSGWVFRARGPTDAWR